MGQSHYGLHRIKHLLWLKVRLRINNILFHIILVEVGWLIDTFVLTETKALDGTELATGVQACTGNAYCSATVSEAFVSGWGDNIHGNSWRTYHCLHHGHSSLIGQVALGSGCHSPHIDSRAVTIQVHMETDSWEVHVHHNGKSPKLVWNVKNVKVLMVI